MCEEKKSEKENGEEEQAPMKRTSSGLRNALFDEIDSLRKGDSNPARARSIAMLANTALKSVEVEIEFHKYVSDTAKHDAVARLGYLELGQEVELSEESISRPKK